MTVTGIVLCGGRSTRMGREKASLPFGAETLLERVVRLVSQAVDKVIIVGRRGQSLPAGIETVHDAVEDQGPLGAIAHGLNTSTSDVNFVAACDMPLIRPEVIRRLLALATGFDACVPVAGGHVMTLCGVYRKALAKDAEALIASGQFRVKALVDRVNARRVDAAELRDIDPDLESFVSCDTPEAYARALSLSGGPGR